MPAKKRSGYDDIIFDCDSTLSAIEGIDELGYIQQHEQQIAAYEKGRTTTLNTLAG